MRNALRRLQVIDVLAGLYAASFFVWLAFRTPATPVTIRVGAVAFYPLGLAVAWASWRNTRVAAGDLRTRLAWWLLTLSVLALWTSGTAWDVYLQLTGAETWPAWIDYCEILQHPLAIAAFFVFPGRSFKGRDRTRFLLDAVLVTIAGSVVALYFGFRLWLVQMPKESMWTAIQGPGLDWVFLVVAAVGALAKRDAATRRALSLLVAAATAYVLANYYFTLNEFGLHPVEYHAGDAVDGFWFAAWVFRWAAARTYWYSQAPAAAGSAAERDASEDYESGWFAYLVVSGCFALLTSQVIGGDRWSAGALTFSAMTMVALLLVRQLVELRESKWLFEAQVAQEARLRLLVERSSDAVLILDARGVVSYASETASSVFGTRAPVRAGTRLADVIREDDRGVLGLVLEGRSRTARLLLHVPGDDHTWREIEAVSSNQRDDPVLNGIVVNCRDVTDQRELERQLRHAQKLDAVGQLAGGLAHDVNNSLAVVRGYAELLRDTLEPDSPGRGDLAHIEQAVDRAASITRKVLAFSRRQPAQPTVLDLSAVVSDLLPMLRQSVTPQVDIRLELEPRAWPVRVDRGQMEQVLVNLAANARDAMPDGGVMTIITANRAVTDVSPASAGLPPGDSVCLTVRDQGTGMTPEVLAHIFEPFFSTKTATGGMGLGLAMVRDIVRGASGRIVVDSAPGKGAVFSIFLPRVHAPVVSETQAKTPQERHARGTVLIVDDEENVRVVARRMLERHGYQVVEAAGGLEALETLGDPGRRIDVLLTDLVMPGLDGRQLIARSATLRPLLPVVCMTGFAGGDDDSTRYGENLVALLSKPFSSDALLGAVGAAASRSAAS